MFFSAQEYLNYLQSRDGAQWRVSALRMADPAGYYDTYAHPPPSAITMEIAEKALTKVKKAIVQRETSVGNTHIGKWLRPWHVVPEVRNFAAPEGDYGIGVEVEFGFKSHAAAVRVAQHVADWDYIALDYEGGANPIECTFPPVLYSTIADSDVVKYTDYLRTSGETASHSPDSTIGTHVNVSVGGKSINSARVADVATILRHQLSYDEQVKYFGRRPYGSGRMGDGIGATTFVEWKLFNSQTDSRRLMQYINIAVELTDLVTTDRRSTITLELVRETLERGYNKAIPEKAAATATSPVKSRTSKAAA